jgi:hypothetical protein
LCFWVRSEAYPRVEHLKELHSGRLWPYSNTQHKAEKAAKQQTPNYHEHLLQPCKVLCHWILVTYARCFCLTLKSWPRVRIVCQSPVSVNLGSEKFYGIGPNIPGCCGRCGRSRSTCWSRCCTPRTSLKL